MLPGLTLTVGVAWSTVVWKLVLLLLGVGSPVLGPTEAAWLMTVPAVALLESCTSSVKVAEVLRASKPIQALNVPLALPAAGALLLQPMGVVQETSVVSAGRRSTRVTLLWALVPLLVTISQ